MKNFYLILTLCFSLLHSLKSQNLSDCSTIYAFEQETITDGNANEIDIVILEFEDVPDRNALSGWEFKNTQSNDQTFTGTFVGDGYLYFGGTNSFVDGGANLVEYRVKINNPGVYRFVFAAGIGYIDPDPAAPAANTEHNDAWIKFPDADAFYGYRSATNTIAIPNNTGINTGNPDPGDATLDASYPGATYKVAEGSTNSNNGFFKAFMNNTGEWRYDGSTSDNDNHNIYVRFDNPGIYTMQLSGRSFGFVVDRAVLYKEIGDFSDLSSNQRINNLEPLASVGPLCLPSPINLTGQKKSATEVDLTWIDNSTSETGFVVEVSELADFSTIFSSFSLGSDISSTTIDGLLEGVNYFFRVKATFAASPDSEYTNSVEITTNNKPTLSGNLEVEVLGNDFIGFTESGFNGLFTDIDGETLSKVKVLTLPEGIDVFDVRARFSITSPNTEINQNDLTDPNGDPRFRFRALNTFTGTTSFDFTISDGFDYAEVVRTMTITVLKPQIQITRNGEVLIDAGDNDFGQVPVGGSWSETFIIENIGTIDLNLSNVPLILTNNNITEYEILQQPAQTVLAPGETTELIVAFRPQSTGFKNNAHIIISSDDFDNIDKDFRIDLFGEGVIDEIAPIFTSQPSVSVPENRSGTVYSATADERVFFTLGAAKDESLFKINGGEISFVIPPDFETPLDADANNEYLIDVTATDLADNAATLAVVITVTDLTDETPPTITSSLTVNVSENSSGTIYTATANEAVTFSLGSAKDENLFTINNEVISFNNNPDFENPQDADANNVYLLDLTATDNDGNITSEELAITVTDITETPPSITSAAELSVVENTTGTVYTATADVEVTFSLETSQDEGLFTLNGNAISFTNAPDFENPLDTDANNIYLLTITATNNENTSSLDIAITVTDIVSEVDITITSGSEVSIAENTTGVIYTTTADNDATFNLGNSKDEALFSLTGAALSFINAPDFETPLDSNGDNIYSLEIIAQDASGNLDLLELLVTVTNVDDEIVGITTFTNDLNVYPNPTSNFIHIEHKNILEVLLIDSKGKTILQSLSPKIMNVTKVPVGNYLLILNSDANSISKKILIRR